MAFIPLDKDELVAEIDLFIAGTSAHMDIENWDVSHITNMDNLFRNKTTFNGDISNWNVIDVTSMAYMFMNATAFDQPIGDWKVGNVTNMDHMFMSATVFNKPIGDWNVRNVTNMAYMFSHATVFDQYLNVWNVESVRDMMGMFIFAVAFNRSLDEWDVSNVRTMDYMFMNATVFNQPLNDWDVSHVTSMYGMFESSGYKYPLDQWDVRRVVNMARMFAESEFNRPLNAWVIANPIDENGGVEDMHGMFQDNHEFDQSLSNWFANGADDGMREIHADVDDMFSGASRFNRNLSRWEVHLHADQSMFNSNGTDMSMTEAYMPTILNYPDDPDEHVYHGHAPADGRAYNVHNLFATINMDALMSIIGPPEDYAGAQPFDEFIQDRLAELITTLPIEDQQLLSGPYETLIRVCLHNVQPPLLYNTVMRYIGRQGLPYRQKYIRSFITDSLNAYGDVEILNVETNRSCTRGIHERIVTSMGPAGVDDDAYIPLNQVLIPPLTRTQLISFSDDCRRELADELLALGDPEEGTPAQKAEKARIIHDRMRAKLIIAQIIKHEDPDPPELTLYLGELNPFLGGKKTRNRNKQQNTKRKTIKPKRKQTKRKQTKRKQPKRTR
jgi:surface protein